MSWSFRLKNGDLVLDQGRVGVVTGPEKLVQDLRCALLEHMGVDKLHPEYGSILDGGTLPDGTETAGIIGAIDPDLIRSFITNEIGRVVRNHQTVQIDRARRDRLRYNKVTLTIGEIIDDFDVDLAQLGDTMVVRITIYSKSGDESTLTLPFTT